MNTELDTIGKRIRACRKNMGYSQETLAAMLYMKKTTICRYEKDEHDIPSSVIVELARALQTTPNYLLMGESHEDSWEEDVIRILDWIKDPAMRKLAIRQLQCIADMI
ncbi:helix-turn-helix domain-containing protein [[Clostridium] aminophilum]|uniref:helix-turn-helix domain-containing protein n=1 Tax=[Clostridium] aminophilum TaxID=1526 RepID=UPI0026EEB278|nr:helix-turn-helix transcriptional regulator [[Clostridium] aminophilum]MDD6195954.1 helix-turn-helix transcriptional regulator [[Clostridium] aminophilum]